MSAGSESLATLTSAAKALAVGNGKLGQHTAVNLNLSGLQALDQSGVVGQAVRAGCRVDALDPETTEVALLLLAVTVAVHKRVQQLLFCLAVQA